MALPNVTLTISDGGLGTVASSSARRILVLGPCPGGTENSLYSFSSPSLLCSTLGFAGYPTACGPTVEAAASILANSGGPVDVMPLAQSSAGGCSAVTHVGTGLAAITVACAPVSQIVVTITGTGALGAGYFTYKIGSEATSASILIPAGGDYRVPGTFTTLTFASATYTSGDVWTISTVGVVTKSGGATGTITQVSSPIDDFQVQIKIIAAGALGAATFQYTLDAVSPVAGATRGGYSATVTTPSGSTPQSYAIPGTGVYAAMATGSGNFVAGDTYSFNTVAPTYGTTQYNAAIVALLALSSSETIHLLVGHQYQAANAATMATAVDLKMTAAETAFRYLYTIMSCPTSGSVVNNAGTLAVSSEADATVAAALASITSERIKLTAGDDYSVSSITGIYHRRPGSIVSAVRDASISPGENPGWVGSPEGSLSGVAALYRDEGVTEALDVARFDTHRSFVNYPGFFITSGRMLAQSTSDFTVSPRRRVMDEACRIARAALLPFVNQSIRVSASTGFIDERDAKRIESVVNAALKAAIVDTGDASASSVLVTRNNNILASNTLYVDVRVTPLGYASFISATLGFVNPATVTA